MRIFILSAFISAIGILPSFAGETDSIPAPEPQIENSFMLKTGSAHRADTYLTPLHYDGWAGALGYEHERLCSSVPLLWRLNVDMEIDRTFNPARNATMWGAQFESRWTMLRDWRVSSVFRLGVGGATTIDVGALYLSRNGNNPVAANASWTLDLAAKASARFHIGSLPIIASYTANLPVAGAMFAPDYGQLYYEIYLGDSQHIFSGAYWGRYFRYDQRIAADLKLGSKYLRLGYECDILSTKVNGIVSRRIDHLFVLGLTIR